MMRTLLRGVVVDPEVVFVANLMKADAPALVASFQCDFTLQVEEDAAQNTRASLRDLKLLACPFIRDKEDKAITSVRSQHWVISKIGPCRLMCCLSLMAFFVKLLTELTTKLSCHISSVLTSVL